MTMMMKKVMQNLVNEVLEGKHLNLGPRFQLRHVNKSQVDKGFVPKGLNKRNEL